MARFTSFSFAAGMDELVPAGNDRPLGWGPARYFEFPNAQGTVGFISPLSRHFCSECNRLRLTADGKLRPCLFSDDEYDVRTALRAGDDQAGAPCSPRLWVRSPTSTTTK